ncbi:hypothetical protein GCM10022251_03400 [Phytohabitans flavus]|uniref:DUF6458 domain-containing protein n=1 Tax=Phytohabitans flavus TaxID=1076124 RepID=A0A6F8Y372_9ACTN|nr:DUF6458 family protein [Phytohabitans flavus]BCB80510.1 hypothetical protein Pflav_069200 [Phytohabitans flavus]
MGIGGSIFLIALGAILAFAVEANLGWLDINVVGWVLMVVGVALLVFTIWFWQSRRRTTTVVQPTIQERVVPVQTERVVEERREVRPPSGRLYE